MRGTLAIVGLLLLAAPAQARDAAQRQLDFCWQELEAGEHDRAVKSATSAFRLDSTRHDALVCKAEALAAAGDDDQARGTMTAYVQLRIGLKSSERAAALMKTLGVNADLASSTDPAGGSLSCVSSVGDPLIQY